MDSVRGKFVLQVNSQNMWSPTARVLKFSAVCNGTEENQNFHKYTPSGVLEMTVDNPSALEFFELGKEYYLDFTKAPTK